MRTPEEIVAKIKELDKNSVLGFHREVMVPYLPYEFAKEFLKPEVTAETWQPTPMTREEILKEMRKYMIFAWGKVEDHRSISASRSVTKMQAWIYLLGDDLDLESIPYAQYGAPKLAAVCKEYGLDVPPDETIGRMIEGLRCEPNCEMGCGV